MALFVKGQSGNPGGKPKGTKDALTRLGVWQTCEQLKFEPIVELIEIAKDKTIAAHTRCTALCELLSYMLPKYRSVEITTATNKNITVEVGLTSPAIVRSESNDNS